MPELVISIGANLSQVALVKRRTTIGRRTDCDIVLDRLTVSASHAALHLRGNQVFIEDLGSTNGTLVNGVPVVQKALEDNDFIEMGGCQILFLDAGAGTDRHGAGSEPTADRPMPTEFAPTEPAEAGMPRVPVLRVLSGQGEGRELSLRKVVTTVGTPGVAVAAVTRRRQGYVAASVMGVVTLNGKLLDTEAMPLKEHDVLELDRATRLAFIEV
ncbi:FHA domain-containing protein [Variovorax sp. GB1R11]|uniref:FHA domain-containing protein n=1 Tax=Variovorax sp. GB1R11 TaxID=3443741 RepID=UPI003F48CEFE